jgi:hypothetical protein
VDVSADPAIVLARLLKILDILRSVSVWIGHSFGRASASEPMQEPRIEVGLDFRHKQPRLNAGFQSLRPVPSASRKNIGLLTPSVWIYSAA